MKKIFLWLHLTLLPFASMLHAETFEEEVPVMVLGSGVGALTSAVYLARSGVMPVVITGPSLGGTITQSHNVQNWPGELSISGVELADKVKKQAEQNGAILRSESVVSVDFSKQPFTVTTKKVLGSTEQIKNYKTQSIIIALGASPHLLNVSGESKYWSQGVYSCAVCDGSLYKDKVVAVVGGGDSALIEAQYLSNIAAKVHIFVRRDEFRTAERARMKEILALSNVEVHFNTTIKEIKGDEQTVNQLIVYNSQMDSLEEVGVDALFLAIGARPNTDLFRNQLELDAQGYIVLKKYQQSSIEGIYAIGDVSDPEFKQAVSAAGDAAKAALQAQKFLASHHFYSNPEVIKPIEIKPETRGVIEISSKEHFEKELREAHGIVFVDFYASYCGPCRMFSPIYDSWAAEHGGKVKFLKVSADSAREIFERYQIRVIPTLIILDEKGNIVRRSNGVKEIADIDKRLEKMKGKEDLLPQDFK